MKTRKNRYIGLLLSFTFVTLLQGCYDDQLYPLVNLKVQNSGFRPEYKFNLDASESVPLDDINGQFQYRWDLNGDHLWDDTKWSFYPVCTTLLHGVKWSQFVGLQVRDDNGNITEISKVVRANDFGTRYTTGEELIDSIVIKTISYNNYGQQWTVDNQVKKTGDGIKNDPYCNFGSYFSWVKANEKMTESLVLPSLKDWQDMIDQCGGTELAGYNMPVDVEHGLKLKYGGKFVDNHFSEVDESGYYWTSTVVDEEFAFAIKLTKGKDELEIVKLPKDYQLSVRLFTVFQKQANN
jgi:uncharacterized protein (TIGR02145 family)